MRVDWLILVVSIGLLGSLQVRGGRAEPGGGRHAVPTEHPRLLGSRQELKDLAQARREAYTRMADVARKQDAGDYEKLIAGALANAVGGRIERGGRSVELATAVP
ncbi:MAG: hypothetical protein COZ06_36350 [Armatimonadetes bacterium CG_4_10_14_3_um_filter_66_18]|nr:hypothetical protein [Armatimonadota bacterium]NCQ28539.1 hypothetical protein [Armatimonadota bacterium]PIY36349.1 MAG: hypothetical protein COZ06_36350 [Armatimonadetes bacterium CG_4_10_14_3_um_filter_66_18]